jgi:hypothetical protein
LTSKISCYSCKKSIDEKLGYVEKEVTIWEDDTEGQSMEYYFHRECEEEV